MADEEQLAAGADACPRLIQWSLGVSWEAMHRRLPWIIALPLMVAGSVGAHVLARIFMGAHVSEGSKETAERASTGVAGHTVMLIGIVAALTFVACVIRLISIIRRRAGSGTSPGLFFVLPPLAFVLQEIVERLFHAEAAPFQSAFEPRFLIGLALQIPLGLVALLAARILLRVAARIARALSPSPSIPMGRRSPVTRRPTVCELPRISALALGYPQRGPPKL